MGNQVDRIGTFRFDKVLSVSLSSGKSVSEDDPQPRSITFMALLHLSEFWDTETSEWVDWADADVEAVAFLPLYFFDFKKTKKQEEFSICKKVVEVFGWDGGSFKALCAGDYSEVKGQVRFEDDTYDKAKFPFKVAWLDTFDATPGRQLRQITGDDLDALDKLMAGKMSSTKAPTKAVSAKGKKVTKPKGKGKPPAKPPKTATPVGKCTDQEAYDACYALSGATEGDETEKKLNDIWQAEIAIVSSDEATITPEQWFQIKETVLKQVSKV